MTGHLNGSIPSAYQLARAILIYKELGRLNSSSIAIEHDVEPGPRLGAGRPVTASFIEAMLLSMETSTLTYVPPNVIATGRNAFAWFVPSASRRLLFDRCHDESVQAFDGKLLPQPPLVFVVRNRSLYIYAVPNNERPTLKTKLWHAPYFNVFEDHRVCLGSMNLPKTIDPAQADEWTDAFFRSNFTHLSGGKNWEGSLTYAQLLDAALRSEHFDPTWLKPTTLTLREALCTS
jgi:PRTRC genetic system protein B